MQNKKKLLRYSIDYLSKYSSSKNNLIRILKNKIKKMTNEKNERFHLYNSIEGNYNFFRKK